MFMIWVMFVFWNIVWKVMEDPKENIRYLDEADEVSDYYRNNGKSNEKIVVDSSSIEWFCTRWCE